jgi:hypothetical protein
MLSHYELEVYRKNIYIRNFRIRLHFTRSYTRHGHDDMLQCVSRTISSRSAVYMVAVCELCISLLYGWLHATSDYLSAQIPRARLRRMFTVFVVGSAFLYFDTAQLLQYPSSFSFLLDNHSRSRPYWAQGSSQQCWLLKWRQNRVRAFCVLFVNTIQQTMLACSTDNHILSLSWSCAFIGMLHVKAVSCEVVSIRFHSPVHFTPWVAFGFHGQKNAYHPHLYVCMYLKSSVFGMWYVVL